MYSITYALNCRRIANPAERV